MHIHFLVMNGKYNNNTSGMETGCISWIGRGLAWPQVENDKKLRKRALIGLRSRSGSNKRNVVQVQEQKVLGRGTQAIFYWSKLRIRKVQGGWSCSASQQAGHFRTSDIEVQIGDHDKHGEESILDVTDPLLVMKTLLSLSQLQDVRWTVGQQFGCIRSSDRLEYQKSILRLYCMAKGV